MKTLLALLIVVLMAGCAESDSIYNPEPFEFENAVFRIASVYENNIEIQCDNDQGLAYSITLRFDDGHTLTRLYFGSIRVIDAGYEFRYVEIDHVKLSLVNQRPIQ
ncbi:MAG: hypothetical protein AAGU19_08130 [Prolixibacteraceae bacterium]